MTTISNSVALEARKSFFDNAQRDRPDRYRIVFNEGWIKTGKPFMVKSQQNEFVLWVDGGGVEDFRIDQIRSFEVLPHPD